MEARQFVKQARRQAAAIAFYIDYEAPAMVVRKTLRFVDGNFRAQGWQGSTFQPWKPKKVADKRYAKSNTILIITGRLRRGLNYSTNGRGEVHFYNNVPYAKIHNEGGTINKSVNVRGFTRRRFYHDEVSKPGAKKEKWQRTHIGDSEVKAHVRKMKIAIPKRQSMPYEGNESPVLNASITRELEREIKKILTL